ncbi:MAG: hypothetical protein H6997_02085 [Moraxellaceae bacterium]|nr:hypothetical protein [Moraxellaceae bacterium]
MIHETTWHPTPTKQTVFHWAVNINGIEIRHGGIDSPSYTIPWMTFQSVYSYACNLALSQNGIVIAGVSMDSPTSGSVGAWVITQNMEISNGILTPRHLSFLGPILGRMGFIQRGIHGSSILWNFN